jgi:uncharacterized protein YigA (DUF484 family)
MSKVTLIERLRFAADDIGRALRYVCRPWSDLHAVQTSQIDIVNAVSEYQADIAAARASLKAFGEKISYLESRAAEHDAIIRQLLERADSLQQQSSSRDTAPE